MRQTRVPLLALSCLVIALVQAGCVEAYFHGWLNQDVGLGFFLAGGIGAVYMTVYGLSANGGATLLGWILLIWINAWVYHMIARLYLWASNPGTAARRVPRVSLLRRGFPDLPRLLNPTAAWAPLATKAHSVSASAS